MAQLVSGLNFCSINVQGLNTRRKQRLLRAYLVSNDIDICLIQETKLRGMGGRGVGAQGGRGGSNIFFEDFYFIFQGNAPRACQGVMVLISKRLIVSDVSVQKATSRYLVISMVYDAQRMVIVNYYAPANLTTNRLIFGDMVMHIPDRKDILIIGGDFNHRNLIADQFYQAYFQTFQLVNVASLYGKEGLPTHLSTAGNTLDYLYVTRGLATAMDFNVVFTTFTDHAALLLTLKVAVGHNVPVYAIYQKHPFISPDILFDPLFFSNIYTDAVQLLLANFSIDNYIEFKSRFVSSLVHYNVLAKRRLNVRMADLRQLMGAMRNINVTDISFCRVCFKEHNLLAQQAEQDRSFMMRCAIAASRQEISALTTSFYFNKHAAPPISFIHDRYSNLTGLPMLGHIHSYFSDVYLSSVARSEHFTTMVAFPIHPDLASQNNFEITKDDIHCALDALNLRSAPGPDLITVKFFRLFDHLFIPHIHQLCNLWLTTPFVDHHFINSYLILHRKRGFDPAAPLSLAVTRPINVQNLDSKIFARVLNDRLNALLPNILCPFHFALKTRTIHVPINILQQVLYFVRQHRMKQVAVLFLDISKAFDYVSHEYLAERILHCFGPSSLSRGLLNYLLNKYISVKHRGRLYYSISVRRGITQGSPLSTNLFAVYIDQLLRDLHSLGHGVWIPSMSAEVTVLSYVDDLTVFIDGVQNVPRVFQLLDAFSRLTGSLFNPEKTHVWFPYENRFDRAYNTTLPGTYLGIPFPYTGIAVRRVVQDKVLARFRQAQQVLKGKPLSLLTRIKIINAYLFPVAYYYAPHVKFNVSFVNALYSIAHRILWSTNLVPVSMHRLCLSIKQGGLGLHDFDRIVSVMRANFFVSYLKYAQFVDTTVEVEPTDTPPPYQSEPKIMLLLRKNYLDIQDSFDQQVHGKFTYKSLTSILDQDYVPTPEGRLLFPYYKHFKAQYFPINLYDFLFHILTRSVFTRDLLVRRYHFQVDTRCPLCQHQETLQHLFMDCGYFSEARHRISQFFGYDFFSKSIVDLFADLLRHKDYILVAMITLFAFWRVRNLSVFEDQRMRPWPFLLLQFGCFAKKDFLMLPSTVFDAKWRNQCTVAFFDIFLKDGIMYH